MKKILIILLLLFTSCSWNTENDSYKEIVEIPEASGICYMEKSDSFFVANDEGKIYEINKKWKVLNKKNIWNYDFEGIICDSKNKMLYLLIEDSWNLLKIDSEKLKIKWDLILSLSKKDRKKYFNKDSGAEWLAYDWKYFYISTQNKEKKNNLLKFSLQQQKNINPSHSHNLKLEKTYDIKYRDLSWMTFYKDELYIVSDKNDLYLIYDLKEEKIKFSEKLKKGNWEWISFDKKGEMFLADDYGKVVKKK